MGRSNPTYRGVLQHLRNKWKPFRRALRQQDQELFDTMMEHADQYADAAGYHNATEPGIAALLSIILGQQKQITHLKQTIANEN